MTKSRYIELATMVEAMIKAGDLPPGTRLPTHRSFAEEHGIALATATRTYNELRRRGLILGEAGRGMFVRDSALPITLGLEQDVNKGLIDLVFNTPGNATDSKVLRDGLRWMASSGDLEAMLRYQPHGGRPHERKIFASHFSSVHGDIEPENLFITSGAQHGLAIAVMGLLSNGDTVGTDPLIYPGFKAAASLHQVPLISVSGEEGVMDPKDLERQCRKKRLKSVYLMPTVHTPLGSVMNKNTRSAIIKIAHKYDLLIIEDGTYAFHETNPPPSFLSLAPDRTIHIGGFSKNIATGLRIGFLIVPNRFRNLISRAIRATTWNIPALISALVTRWIEDGTIVRFEAERRKHGARGQKICRKILRDIPIVSHPNASFAWLPLRRGARAEPIIARLSEKGIAVSSAVPFSVGDAAPQALRIAFGGVSEQELRFSLECIRTEITSVS
ncbi:MAG: PLP-dependent aminotransferase family protein [Hyphomicrobiales bacterium]|nr:PLP-dependent aminotransferase family protein [Hyphomicrobiales bacterium]MCY4053310.1 PLP-dependent aminotransferase family protein [Hyphomicrobiales bacterium]